MLGSAAFFVNANSSAFAPDSPTSYFCAKLASTISSRGSAISSGCATFPLFFFCSRHTYQTDVDAGPTGMLRNLIAQLLNLYPSFSLETMAEIERIDLNDTNELCRTLESLVDELPTDTTIFCIIDGVSAFESRATYEKDFCIAVETLVGLAHGVNERAATIKVLFASTSRSRLLQQHLDSAEMLILPETVPSAGSLTQSIWSNTVGSDVAHPGEGD